MSFKVVILSARASNLVPCVRSILGREPELSPDRIIVVDDGARAEAEGQLPAVHWQPGRKPFVFACNANLGIAAAGRDDVILLNDDARLLTTGGLTRLAEQAHSRPDIGVCSAGIRGVVGNPRQVARPGSALRIEPAMLAFVCVYIPRAVYERLGPFDERFTGYGCEDTDYCERAKAVGLKLAVYDGCVVDHGSTLASTFRTRSDYVALFERNRRLYDQKWAGRQPLPPGCVDLFYLSCNRLEFTRETFTALLRNTDWGYVHELFVYDDGSRDGTREWLEEACTHAPVPVRFRTTAFRSPVAAMNHFVKHSTAPIMAKCDNDAMYPPGWLRQSLDVLARSPDLMLLGIEALVPYQGDDAAIVRSYSPAEFVSGLGLYRRTAFDHGLPRPYARYFGLEEWQKAHPGLARGWITPALPVFVLDRFPFDPWASWSRAYVDRGWQRQWPSYDPATTLWRWRWADGAYPPSWEQPAETAAALAPAGRVRETGGPERSISNAAGTLGDESQPGPNSAHPSGTGHAERREASETLHAERPGASEARHAEQCEAPGTAINLAWCDATVPGLQNVRVVPGPGGGDVDLRQRWPWADGSISSLRAWDILQHLPDAALTMGELWRVLRPGGSAEIAVPTTDGPGAWADPMNVSCWNRRSFSYYEAGNPYRELLVRRTGMPAQFRVLAERTEPTADGPRLVISLQAVKADTPSSQKLDGSARRLAPTPIRSASLGKTCQVLPSPVRFVGALRVKNEAAHLHEVLTSILPLCERVLILDDHSTDDTVAVCRSFSEAVTVLASPFEGMDEARDKNYLLQKIVEVGPEWVLWIDGDEVLERSGPEALRLAAGRPAARGIAAYSLRIAYLWDGPGQVRVDGIWGRFYRPSFFRLFGQPVDRLAFRSTGCGGNFHCGNVPEGLAGRQESLRVRLKHYGYMAREQRQAKYRFYTEHDPGNALEDNYRHLAETPGARWAPGPAQLVPWTE